MEDLSCSSCQVHLGWIGDSAPRGFIKCDTCKDRDDEEEADGEDL